MKEVCWTTNEGKELKISEMETPHIENCIKMIDRYAENGLEQVIVYGYAQDNDYMEGDVDVLYGEDVYEHFGKDVYEALKQELKKRVS